MTVSVIVLVSVLFFLFPWVTFYFLVRSQHSMVEHETYRLQVLSTRTAFCLPVYATFLYAALLEPKIYEALLVIISFVEGYTFYCFTTLLVVNMGGPTETVRAMKQRNDSLCCTKYCCSICQCWSEDKTKFYRGAVSAMWHFWITRTAIVLLGTFAYYTGTDIGHIVYVVFTLVAAVMLLWALSGLINLYENIYSHAVNINGIGKVFLLKCSVGMITLLEIVANFIIVTGGKISPPGNNDDDNTDMTQRSYAALMLLIFCALSIVTFNFFAAKITAPRILYNTSEIDSGMDKFTVTMSKFLCDIFSFRDVYGILKLKDEPLLENDSFSKNSESNWL